jgi:arylsulfatase A
MFARLLSTITFTLATFGLTHAAPAQSKLPNFVVLFADDLGYGDLSCYGHPIIRTPNLDRMAAEGIRFTQFYVAECVCTPSRAALLTGRLPIRTGMCSDKRRVLFHNSAGGLPAEEITLAEALKAKGYATGCFGKWHLGHLPQYLPTSNGFDTYLGLPYSNDMDRVPTAPAGRAALDAPKIQYWNVPLIKDTQIIERPAEQSTLTRRYTDAAIEFIKAHKAGPFFVYLPHTMPHTPLFASTEFAGRSPRGTFGDVVEELDANVGRVLDTLRSEGLAENTLVWFTSDNGPWLTQGIHGGSAGLLRDGKGATWEGGMREPAIAWWPGKVPGGRVSPELGATLDILPTCLTLAGVPVPQDRVMDGYDLGPVLFGTGPSPRDTVYYYRGRRLMALRHGPWKAHFITQAAYGPAANMPETHDPPILYNLEIDPSEKENVATAHPDVLQTIRGIVAAHQKDFDPPPSQLESLLPAAE